VASSTGVSMDALMPGPSSSQRGPSSRPDQCCSRLALNRPGTSLFAGSADIRPDQPSSERPDSPRVVPHRRTRRAHRRGQRRGRPDVVAGCWAAGAIAKWRCPCPRRTPSTRTSAPDGVLSTCTGRTARGAVVAVASSGAGNHYDNAAGMLDVSPAARNHAAPPR
jgi:hypothetical protein